MRSIVLAAAILAAATAALGSGCASTPKSPEERSRQAVALYKEGVQQFNDGRIDPGITALKKANELQPGYTLLRYDLGRMLLVRAERSDLTNMQLQEEAKQLHQESKHEDAKRKEDEAIALHRQAMGDLRDAQSHFLWVQDAWPQEANVPYFLSIVSTGLGDYGAARKFLKRAMEIGNPEGPQREKLERALEMLDQAELQEKRLREKR